MGTFSDEEVEAAFATYERVQAAGDWDAFCDLFTDDAEYVEHEFGTFEGRDAIREWLVPTMAPLVGWTYPVRWHLVGDDKVVLYWENIMPTPAGDDGSYSFFGITVITYGGDGKWSREEDIYNYKVTEAVLDEWLAAGGKLGEA